MLEKMKYMNSFQLHKKHYLLIFFLFLLTACWLRPTLTRNDLKKCAWKYADGYYLGADIISFNPKIKGYRVSLSVDENNHIYNSKGEFIGTFLPNLRSEMQVHILSPKGKKGIYAAFMPFKQKDW
jgi:hypothetical protein